jgi:hypothetical protein
MAGYVRQSTADIIPTATVRAAPINAEYNAFVTHLLHQVVINMMEQQVKGVTSHSLVT